MSAETQTRGTGRTSRKVLQWGRTSMSAETRESRLSQQQLEELQWGRTSMSAETCERRREHLWDRACFNGAALQGVRKLAAGVDLSRAYTKLQWGRTSMSAETTVALQTAYLYLYASMGPHFNECGNLFDLVTRPTLNGASMGPHFNECGNYLAHCFVAFIPWLQWGRTSMSAETPPRTRLRTYSGRFNGAALQ